jgi:CelD/BcsL family acetyltransferase involved in cellulose biosynthesis
MTKDPSGLRIVEVGDRDALTALRETWCALQARCPRATPYQTWEWNEAWWRHFGSRKRARLLLFYADHSSEGDHSRNRNEPVGIAPLYTSWHLGTPVRRLAWMGTGVADYLEPLACPQHEAQVTLALLQHLESALRGWDIADLQQLRPDAPLLQNARANPRHAQSILPMEPCPYLVLPPTWEQFTARLGKKLRSNLGYSERLLHKTFADFHLSSADADTREAGMTALFELHQRRWNARWLPGVLGSRRVQAFHREVAARFLERGWLRLHLLHADGDCRAALYCFAHQGRTSYYLGGFAPDYARFSLGTLLTGRAIRQAITEGHIEFDFLRGAEPYKYRWQPEQRINHRLLLLHGSDRPGGLAELPGRAGFALNHVERYVELRAKAFIEQQGRNAKESNRKEPNKHEIIP